MKTITIVCNHQTVRNLHEVVIISRYDNTVAVIVEETIASATIQDDICL
ncbi:MAG: hypothetical protein JSU72_09335 [Deltaproteobacteria bacterium]|nr:MAG: hypothetical protein JSU72_09335 [Deltaproteobacteria bacterium]